MAKLNPAWISYNNTHNEGGEGFNPHPKYLTAVQAVNKIVPADPATEIAAAEARLAKTTDLVMRKMLETTIAQYRKMLGK